MVNNEKENPPLNITETNKNQIEIVKDCIDEIPEFDSRAKIGPKKFITILIFTFLRDRGKRTLESLRRNIMEESREKIARSTFWERLATKRLLKFLILVVGLLMKKMLTVVSPISKELLKKLGVTGILVVDSTSTTLRDDAQDEFPGPRNNVAPAAIKWHCCINIITGIMEWCEITPATTHDSKCFPVLDTIRDKLIIFDLGYYSYDLMNKISEIAYFLCRVKTNAVIKIIEIKFGLEERYNGMELPLTLPKSKNIIEVLGVTKINESLNLTVRVIGFWNPVESKYHWYFTNLKVPAFYVYTLYRLRWQIELVFKACKSSFTLKDMPSGNTNIIMSMHLLTLILVLVSFPFAKEASLELEDEKQASFSFQRASIFFIHISKSFIQFLLKPFKENRNTLLESINLFIPELFDPNYKKRGSSLKNIMLLAEVNF